jgi:uncharacterized damage-inducible protein DinB
MKLISPPLAGVASDYQQRYINLVGNNNVLALLETQILDFKALLSEVPFEQEDYAYAEGKWSFKQLAGHLIDTERILTYRALCIARGEKQVLPGFEENEYVANASFHLRSLYDLGHEFGAVREATVQLFRYMTEEELDRKGIANNAGVTPRIILFMICGHHMHHVNVMRERYAAVLP